ncbi:hypothetical protein [Xanthomonas arboricola]|uniref:hypothetical protein n=1 Tax=Xanthomonas arboricola TaxID=56448 RepID=UPI000CED85EF|nr:hypothetical protein [Xanthomonas arboricola]PPU41853.1 hypothetical protein XaplCFBP3123_01560 [Xanthomonas arboricola pv. populi]
MKQEDIEALSTGLGGQIGNVCLGSMTLVHAVILALAEQPGIDGAKLVTDITDLLETVTEGTQGAMAKTLSTWLQKP